MLGISDVQWQKKKKSRRQKLKIKENNHASYILLTIKGKIYTETAPTVGDIFNIRGYLGICSRQVFR
jgi:hypothetical protein